METLQLKRKLTDNKKVLINSGLKQQGQDRRQSVYQIKRPPSAQLSLRPPSALY